MFREYQCVRLRRQVAPMDRGAEGTIVMAYSEPPGYDVEFMDADGKTLALLTSYDEDLESAEN